MMAVVSLVQADATGWNHMDGWGWGMVIFGWLFMALIAASVGWLIWSSTQLPGDRGLRARSLLDQRYARGEVERDEYLERKADLE